MYEITFFGWCYDGGSDKVWGYVTMSDTVYNFWGRRGKSLAFQHHPISSARSFQTKARGKVKKGYHEMVGAAAIEKAWPGFVSDFERQFITAKLMDNFRHQSSE